jgi:hypothetical protein
MIVNYYELFNKSLKKKLEINSFNSQASLKSYSYKNIPKKIYEVKIISNNQEDAQKFFEKYIKEVANEVNSQIINQFYIDFLSDKIRTTRQDLIKFNKCRNVATSEARDLLKTDSLLSNECEYIYSLTLFTKNNPNHPYFTLFNNYLNQVKNFNLDDLTFPLRISLEQYFQNLGQPSFNPLQIP